MTLTLKIYDNHMKNVVKIYTTEQAAIRFGVVEDLMDLIDVDKLSQGTNAEIAKVALVLITKGKDSVKELLKNTFDGVTDDELRNTNTAELVGLIVNIVKYTAEEMARVVSGKN